MPAYDPELAKASGRAKAALILGILGAGVGVLNIVLLFTIGYILIGWLAVTGAIAIVLGLMVRGKLKDRDPAGARKATIGTILGAVGVVLIVVSLVLAFGPLAAKHTVIMDAEMAPVDAEMGVSQVFELTGGSWTMTYDIQGAAGDSFTACIIEEGTLQAWVEAVQPTDASGHACDGPDSRAQGTARLVAGDYELAVYCWNTVAACQLTWNLEGDP